MNSNDISEQLAEQVRAAAESSQPLHIRGGGTKDFYGRRVDEGCTAVDVTPHQGVVAYEPTELAITVRTGTPLAQVRSLLAEQGQQLPFEPPAFGPGATIGGVVATGLSGPRRPFMGAVRDAVLGVKIINGRGEILEFGGRVMKNVAGYDVSRLMAGAMGGLGLMLEVSLKVLPVAPQTLTLTQSVDAATALDNMRRWGRLALPVTGLAHTAGTLFVRLGGGEEALTAARREIAGDELPTGDAFWEDLREQRLDFFQDPRPLWRVSIPPATPEFSLRGDTLTDWGGALRWVKTDMPAGEIRDMAAEAGGHATWFRGHDGLADVFQPLPEVLMRLHHNVKQALDPQGIFNPGRLYSGL